MGIQISTCKSIVSSSLSFSFVYGSSHHIKIGAAISLWFIGAVSGLPGPPPQSEMCWPDSWASARTQSHSWDFYRRVVRTHGHSLQGSGCRLAVFCLSHTCPAATEASSARHEAKPRAHRGMQVCSLKRGLHSHGPGTGSTARGVGSCRLAKCAGTPEGRPYKQVSGRRAVCSVDSSALVCSVLWAFSH